MGRYKITMENGTFCYWSFEPHEFKQNFIYWYLEDKDGKVIDSILLDRKRAMKLLKRTQKIFKYKAKKVKK